MSATSTFLGVAVTAGLIAAGTPALMGASTDSFNQGVTLQAFSSPPMAFFLAAERPGDGGANHDRESKETSNMGSGDNQEPTMPETTYTYPTMPDNDKDKGSRAK
jgi:hypothetical protein